MRAATALHPHGQILKAAVVQAQGAITTPGTPAASPFWGRGGAGGPARPPQDTHTHSSGFTLRSHSGWRIPAIPASLSFLATITPSATL